MFFLPSEHVYLCSININAAFALHLLSSHSEREERMRARQGETERGRDGEKGPERKSRREGKNEKGERERGREGERDRARRKKERKERMN